MQSKLITIDLNKNSHKHRQHKLTMQELLQKNKETPTFSTKPIFLFHKWSQASEMFNV